MPEKRTHDYVRHGTTSLLPAFNTADGTVISSLHRRHRSTEFKKFLSKVDAEVPDDLEVHLICDNYSTHKHPTVVTWLEAHQRFHMHFTPTYSSWIYPGSTRSNGSSPTSPPTFSSAATTAPSRPSRKTSATGSKPGTRTPSRSSGANPPTSSWPHSDDFFNELLAQDASLTRNKTSARAL